MLIRFRLVLKKKLKTKVEELDVLSSPEKLNF